MKYLLCFIEFYSSSELISGISKLSPLTLNSRKQKKQTRKKCVNIDYNRAYGMVIQYASLVRHLVPDMALSGCVSASVSMLLNVATPARSTRLMT